MLLLTARWPLGFGIKPFRPDACEHSVTRVLGGSRYVLSVGWVLPARPSTG
jgi:hypothetical protein